MKIRPLKTHNKKEVSRLLRQAKTFNDQEVRVALEVVDEALRRPEKGDYCAFCILNSDGTLAGFICFGPIPMTEGCYDLYWIVVDKAFSRRGVGGKLLEFMEDFVIKKGARRIYVDTSSTPPYEPARALYEKHGYRVVGLLEDFYRKGDHKVIFMKEVTEGV
ncbi:MAG: GNAT family N-acetyltransferase [Deltaproteobacteria bacterium]|nr:MAG: GNAT family N-acetyltransferase [Deltaproteobacteria bacterium]